MPETKDQLQEIIYEIENAKIRVFKDEKEVSRLLDEKRGQSVSTYDITPYKEYSKQDIRKFIIEGLKDNVFYQHLNAINISFISTADDDTRYKISDNFPYINNNSFPQFTATKLYYTDGTTEDCNFPIMGEIPTGKLILKMDIKVDYKLFADVKRIRLSDNPEYAEGDKFARLIGMEGDEVKLWMSDAIYKKSFIVAGTRSGKTIYSHNAGYSKSIKGQSAGYKEKMQSLKEELKKILAGIEENNYSNNEEVIREIIKIFPKEILEKKRTNMPFHFRRKKILSTKSTLLYKNESCISEKANDSRPGNEIRTHRSFHQLVEKYIVAIQGEEFSFLKKLFIFWEKARRLFRKRRRAFFTFLFSFYTLCLYFDPLFSLFFSELPVRFVFYVFPKEKLAPLPQLHFAGKH